MEKQQAAGTVRYNWDGLNVLLERDGEDEPLTTHTHGPVPIAGIGTHLTTRKHGETPEDLWYHHDAIGSTRQLSDETQPPALTRQNLLDAWGNLLATAGTQDTPYRFTGKETDPDTGLIYFGRRFYDPAIGRWLNRDPARDGQNWYEYAASNPMARVDAEGLEVIDPQDYLGKGGSTRPIPADDLRRMANEIERSFVPPGPEPIREEGETEEDWKRRFSLACIEGMRVLRQNDLEAIWEFYRDLWPYLRSHGYRRTAYLGSHWMSGGGQDITLPFDYFTENAVLADYQQRVGDFVVSRLWVGPEHPRERRTYQVAVAPSGADWYGAFGHLKVAAVATAEWDERRQMAHVTVDVWFAKKYDWDVYPRKFVPLPDAKDIRVQDNWAAAISGEAGYDPPGPVGPPMWYYVRSEHKKYGKTIRAQRSGPNRGPKSNLFSPR